MKSFRLAKSSPRPKTRLRNFPNFTSCLRIFALTSTYSLVSFWLAQVISEEVEPALFIWVVGTYLISAMLMATWYDLATNVFLWVTTWYPQSWIGYEKLRQKATHIHKPWDTWKEGIKALIFPLVAVAVTVIIASLVIYYSAPTEIDPSKKNEVITLKILDVLLLSLSGVFASAKMNQSIAEVLPRELESLSGVWTALWVMWLGSRLLLYQIDARIHEKLAAWRERRADKSFKKSAKLSEKTKVANPQPVDPIEQELNELKAKLIPIKSTSEAAEWYIFRSGKAEGPYTKEQLRNMKITARTSVRRKGEKNWTKAINIPELEVK